MFKHKKIALFLVGLFALAGCTKPPVDSVPDGTTSQEKSKVRLQVWGPLEEKEMYVQNAAAFQALYPNIEFKVDYGEVGEPDAAKNVLADTETSADVFLFPDDQLGKLVDKEVIASLPTALADKVKARDNASAVDAATMNDTMYGFPITADNGYFLVYNKDFLNEEDVKTLEGIMAKTTAEHQLVVDLGNAYYSTSFIQYISDISFDAITETHTTNFDSQDSVDAIEGVINILRHRKDNGFKSVDFNGAGLDDLLDINGNKAIAGVTGNWNILKLKEILGDRLGTAKLPTFKNSKGVDVQWGSFAGSKLVGVKASSQHLAVALAFADFMTDEAAQMRRYEANGWGPSNKAVAADEKLSGELGLIALAAQAPYAIPQGKSVGGKFWDNAAAVGNFILDGPADTEPGTPQTVQEVLTAFVSAITA